MNAGCYRADILTYADTHAPRLVELESERSYTWLSRWLLPEEHAVTPGPPRRSVTYSALSKVSLSSIESSEQFVIERYLIAW